MVIPSPLKRAVYYTEFHKLTYFISDKAQLTLFNLTESQARAEIRAIALSHKEVVQQLEIVPNNKI